MTERGALMTFGEHLDALRRMLFRILGVTLVLGVAVFCLKDATFRLLLAPTDSHFVTWRWLDALGRRLGIDLSAGSFRVELISTELAAQFKTHVTTSLGLALLAASPYIVFELFRFVAPALYAAERRRSRCVVAAVYVLFAVGVAVSYYVVFPISLRFLGTYQVAPGVTNQINLSSYVSMFTRLTFLMGLVFQLPVAVLFLTRMGLVSAALLRHYRRHAVLLICIVAAVITPPDALSLVLVATPMCLLYEVSLRLAGRVERRRRKTGGDGRADA